MPSVLGMHKPIIGMAHFAALPGRRGYDPVAGVAGLEDGLRKDLEALQEGGVDAVLFANEGDLPYRTRAKPAEVAAMAAVIARLSRELSVPFGVDLMWDPVASLAVACATGARFVRGVLMGEYESDVGLIGVDAAELFDLRHHLGADGIALFHNVTPEFAAPLSQRPVSERARSAAYLGVDGLLVSGPAAGRSVSEEDLTAVRTAVPDLPVLVNTGVSAETVAAYLQRVDGVIVGTSLKYGGSTWNAVDPARVRDLVRRARNAGGREDG